MGEGETKTESEIVVEREMDDVGWDKENKKGLCAVGSRHVQMRIRCVCVTLEKERERVLLRHKLKVVSP